MLMKWLALSALGAVCWAGVGGDLPPPTTAVAGSDTLVVSNELAAKRHWGGQRLIDGEAAYEVEPRLAMDAAGRTSIAWRQQDASGAARVWVTRMNARGGAALPAQPVSDAGTTAWSPDIAVSGSGNLFVAWLSRGKQSSAICLRRLVADTERWQPQQCLDRTGSAEVTAPRIATNAEGASVVAWLESESLMSSHFEAGEQKWSAPRQVAQVSTRAASAQIALDARGNAILVWQQAASGRVTRLVASRFDVSESRWTDAEEVDAASPGEQFEPRIAVDGAGDALVVWQQRDSVDSGLRAARYDAANRRFGASASIAANAGPADLAIDAAGNAIVAWTEVEDDRLVVRVRRQSAATKHWDESATIAAGPLYSLRDPSVSLDAQGGAVVVWGELHEVFREHVFAAHFDPMKGTWRAPVQIGEQARWFGNSTRVAIDSSGAGLAVWAGYRALRANTFR
jgi:hypothetical protein